MPRKHPGKYRHHPTPHFYNACSQMLRGLVSAWLHDATAGHNAIADVLLQSLYRWVSHPGGALHDPGLQRTLHGLMGKLFAQVWAGILICLLLPVTWTGAWIWAGHMGALKRSWRRTFCKVAPEGPHHMTPTPSLHCQRTRSSRPMTPKQLLAQPNNLQLVAEMRKLGATIVAANFNTIILCTGKRNVAAAAGCVVEGQATVHSLQF